MGQVAGRCDRSASAASPPLIARDPVVDALTGHAQTPGDLGHLPAVLHDGQHRLIPLLHDA
jgi:hypothetical protein